MLVLTDVLAGSFLEYIDSEQFDRVASGHYATVELIVLPSQAVQTVLKLSADEVCAMPRHVLMCRGSLWSGFCRVRDSAWCIRSLDWLTVTFDS